MVCMHINVFFIVTVVASQATDSARPKPSGIGGGNLGIVIPHLSGWGWNPTTPPPETTTGWIEETTEGWTTPAPETTTSGWQGWSDEYTTYPPEDSTGWPAPGWASSEAVEIEMVGESAVVGEGEAGATHGSQTIVTGDASNPAVANIQTGSYSSLGQGSGIMQVSSISSTGDSSTFQGIDGYNFGDGGEYYGGSLSGNSINTLNGGGSFVIGQGGIGQGGFTQNSALPQVGWNNGRK